MKIRFSHTALLSGIALIAISSAHATDYNSTVYGTNPSKALNDGDTVTITTVDTDNPALWSDYTGLSIIVNGAVTLTSHGMGLGVATASDGGTIDLGDGSIITGYGTSPGPGDLSTAGILSWEAGSQVTGKNVTINIEGDGGYGLYALNSGTIDLSGKTTINVNNDNTLGNSSTARGVTATTGSISLEDVDVTMGGRNGTHAAWYYGIYANSNASINVTGTTKLDINGGTSTSFGVLALTGSTISLNDVSGHVTSDYSNTYVEGFSVRGNNSLLNISGNVNLDVSAPGTSTTTSGVTVYDNAKLSMNNGTTQMNVSGTIARGFFLYQSTNGYNDTTVDIKNLHLNVTGTDYAYNIVASGASGVTSTSNMTVSDSVLNSNGHGIVVAASTLNLSMANTQMTNDSGWAFIVDGSGTSNAQLRLNADASSFSGAALTGASGTFNLALDNGSRWIMTSNSNLSNLINNNSAIIFSSPSGDTYKSMTVSGNYTGDNGLIVLNGKIGGDDSPTDQLIIAGDALGTTGLNIQNNGGSGAPTVQGIEVVSVGGVSTFDAFHLDSGSSGYRSTTGQLAIGAYDYSLIQGGVGGNAQSWYLVSSATTRSETGVYVANSDAAQNMFSMTLRDREGYVQRKADGNEAYSGWVRVYGWRSDQRTAHNNIGASSNVAGVQLGVDLLHIEDAQYGSFYAGVMGGYGSASTKGRQRITGGLTSDGSVKGYSVGLYGTWYQNDKAQEKGAYIDAWLEYNWFDNTLNGSGLRSISYDADGVLASIEAGYGFRLSESATTWVNFEPQAQLFYSSLSTDTHKNNGTTVRLDDEDGWAIRIGGRLNATHKMANGMIIKPFLEANYWHTDWGLDLRLNDDKVNNLTVNDFAEVKVGVAMQHPSGWQPYGQINTRFDTDHYQSYGGQLGVKYHW